MTLYTATINRPGYLPDTDSPPPLFRTPNEAWRYLYEEHSAAWDRDNDDELHRDHVPLGVPCPAECLNGSFVTFVR